MTVPDGRSPGIEASKQKALERVNSEQQQQDRVSAFDSNSFSLLDGASGTPQKSNPQNAITQSQEANREVSQLLNDFYSTPKTDPQVEELKRQVEELESRLETKPQTPPDPMEIAEKQYALAAKYFNNQRQTLNYTIYQLSKDGELIARRVLDDDEKIFAIMHGDKTRMFMFSLKKDAIIYIDKSDIANGDIKEFR